VNGGPADYQGKPWSSYDSELAVNFGLKIANEVSRQCYLAREIRWEGGGEILHLREVEMGNAGDHFCAWFFAQHMLPVRRKYASARP